MVTGSAVKTTAHKICKASFLAPWGVISPFNRFPPVTLNDAINYFFRKLLFRLLLLLLLKLFFR